MSSVAAAHGDTRGQYDSVAALYLPVAIVVAAVVLGALSYAVVRYRGRPGRMPRPTREHRGRELAIAAVLIGIVAVLVAKTYDSDGRYAAVAAARPDLRVDVTAFRWGWRFAYPDLGGIASVSGVRRPAILRVPAGATVRFRVLARDVVHSFWVPELKFKRDVFPMRQQSFDLRFGRTAAFLGGRCAVFCGLKHADMGFSVVVMPRNDFDAWAAARRRAGG